MKLCTDLCAYLCYVDVRSKAAITPGSHGNTQAPSSAQTTPPSALTTPTSALATPFSALATCFHGTTPAARPTPILVTAPLTLPLSSQSKGPHLATTVQSHDIQSHDGHVTGFPLLPAPPIPHVPMGSYPSALQDRGSGQTTTAGSGIGPHSRSRTGMGLHRGAGSVVGPQTTGVESRSPRMGPRSSGGSGMGHHAGGLSLWSGSGMDSEEGLFDPAGLSTDDRVAAYLAAESGESLVGGRGMDVRGGGKRSRGERAASSSGEAASKAKSKKRKRI